MHRKTNSCNHCKIWLISTIGESNKIQDTYMSIFKKVILVITSVSLFGCSAIDKSIKYGKLDVQTRMSKTVFLDPVEDNKKSVVLQIRNTSDKKDLAIESEIKMAIQEKGYKIVTDPKKAHFMIQANILQVGKSTQADPFSSLTSGYGGAFAGSTIGALASLSRNNYTGAAVGGFGGGLIETVSDAAVQVVNYQMITDLQISEKANDDKSKWKQHQTRIISVAKKVNLKFETALPELKQGLVQSISGLL